MAAVVSGLVVARQPPSRLAMFLSVADNALTTPMEYEQTLRRLLANGRADIGRIVLSTPAMLFFLLSPRAGFEDEPVSKLYAAGILAYALLVVVLFVLLGALF